MTGIRSLIGVLCIVATSNCFAQELPRLAVPEEGKFYHGVTTGPFDAKLEAPLEDRHIGYYYRQAGQPVAWALVEHDWSRGAEFPWDDAEVVGAWGAVPFIRLLMISSNVRADFPFESVYTLDAIIKGTFDRALTKWANEAVKYGKPLMVEFGPECNGKWFPWNGLYHGAGATGADSTYGEIDQFDGPERFRDAYRHIIEVMDKAGASNITWVFHVNANDDPPEDWNRLENYYPGDAYIDWLAVSCYGAQQPLQPWSPNTFSEVMDPVHARLVKMAPTKPIIVAEFGTTAGYFEQNVSPQTFEEMQQFIPGNWAKAALEDILSGNRKNVIGFAWWNENWSNDGNPANDTRMRLESDYGLSRAFRETLHAHQDRLGAVRQVTKDAQPIETEN